jgi:hypothetical protein
LLALEHRLLPAGRIPREWVAKLVHRRDYREFRVVNNFGEAREKGLI